MIRIEELTKQYGNGRGVRNVSLDVKKGDILGLLGPNGSGKTTLMKAALGLVSCSGKIEMFGKDIHEGFEQIMMNTGALIEAPAIYKELSAYNNMYLAAKKADDIKDIDSLLKLVQLYQYKNDKAGKFSLGMKQRLGLAMALIGKPSVVFLDEPVNGLDIEGMVEIRELIHKMNAENGTTFIISSHMAAEIEKTCTKAAIMYEGELIDVCSMSEILQRSPSLEEYFLQKVKGKRGDHLI